MKVEAKPISVRLFVYTEYIILYMLGAALFRSHCKFLCTSLP